MAEKRINDESRRIATSAYLKPGNYVLIDGEDGSAKAPLTLFGSVRSGGALTDAASVTVPNNALSTLTTAQSALTLNVNCSNYEVPNFAVEITTAAAVTITVTKTLFDDETNEVISTTTLKYSAAGGNELDSGKTYQLTCVGTCWTLAEFVDPSAVEASLQSSAPENRGLPLSGDTQEETVEEPLEEPIEDSQEEAVEEPSVGADEPSASGQTEPEGPETSEPSVTDNVTETTQQDNGGDAR